MNKIWIIIKREYLSRVAKKSFWLTTLLVPLFIALFYGLMIYISVKDSADNMKIAVVDYANVFPDTILKTKKLEFESINIADTNFKNEYAKKGFDAFLIVNKQLNDSAPVSISLTSKKQIGIEAKSNIENKVEDLFYKKSLIAKGLKEQDVKSLRPKIITIDKVGEGKDAKKSVTDIATVLGYLSGFLIYFTLFIYGMMVMRGVMEEKISRISEIMVSSVKPFQLMTAKIIGIGAVGLTQFLIWIVLMLIVSTIGASFIPAEKLEQLNQANKVIQDNPELANGFLSQLNQLNFPLIIGCFIFYFIGGYLMYGALFGAVGSMVSEDQAEAQQLTLPITMPIIVSIVILLQAVKNPNGGLAVFASIFPLTSPIVMMGRIAFDPPWWQIALSMLFLILGFLFTTWLAGKIYRTGILMYGKKPSFKEMWKAIKS